MVSNSTISAGRFEPEASNMIRIDHFTGMLLISDEEANHLRALLDDLLPGVTPMPIEEAKRIVAEREAAFAEFLASVS